jgi:hypothetical protein
MMPPLVWVVTLICVVGSVVSSNLYYGLSSVFFALLLCLIEVTSLQSTWLNIGFYVFLTLICLIICLLLSPAQALLPLRSRKKAYKFEDVWEPKQGIKVQAEYVTTLKFITHREKHYLIFHVSLRSIFAVHGLGSDPDTAWAHSHNGFNWLQDLPRKLDARTIAFYHGSHWKSHSLLLSLDDLGRRLLDVVERQRSNLSVSITASHHQRPPLRTYFHI